jgi:16S rRNA (uracil1498-N3)-methyltransferase
VARRIRLLVTGLESGRFVLDADESNYVSRVHRLGVGARVVVADPEQGTEAEATIAVLGRRVEIEVGPVARGSKPGLSAVELVWGIGKGDKLQDVLRDLVALGAGRLWLLTTQRSVPRLSERAEQKRERWLQIAKEVTRQCERSDLPVIEGPCSAQQIIERSPNARRIVLQPGAAAQSLLSELEAWQTRRTAHDPVQLWIGPEGGFDAQELADLLAVNCVLADLGPLILRTETAACAALALATAIARRA